MTAENETYIQTLLTKYWNCETSLAEEQELREFFSQENLPAAWQHYAPLFNYVREEQAVTLSQEFDERLKAAMEKEAERDKKYITFTIRVFAPLLRIAASVLLISTLGVSFYFISRQNKEPRFVETYGDPKAAMKDATYALEVLSNALETTEEASRQTIDMIDDLNIDWAALDSIAAEEALADSLEAATQDNDTLTRSKFIPENKKEESI